MATGSGNHLTSYCAPQYRQSGIAGEGRPNWMTKSSSRKFFLLSAAMGGLVLAIATPAQSQPGFSTIDQTKPDQSKQDINLAPHPTPPTVTPLEKIPLDKIKLPPGFKAEIYSHGHPAART